MLTPLSPLSLSVVQVMSHVGPLQVSGGDGATAGWGEGEDNTLHGAGG